MKMAYLPATADKYAITVLEKKHCALLISRNKIVMLFVYDHYSHQNQGAQSAKG